MGMNVTKMNDELFPDLPRNKTRMEIWKEAHGVKSSVSDIPDVPENKWFAYSEKENMCFGASEEDACFNLAERMKLPWP